MAEKKYVYIDVVDTALLCGLDIKPGTLGNNEVQARCPYCGDYKYRMYLSRQPEKSTFWCHNCGTGGNAVTLYADFNPGGRRLTTKEAYLELLDHPQVHTGESPYEHDRYIPEPIRPLHERSQIYLELLSLLTLEKSTAKICCAAGSRTRSFAGTCTAVFRQTGNSAGRPSNSLPRAMTFPVCLGSIPGISGGICQTAGTAGF